MASKAGIVPMVLAAVVGGSAALLLTQLYFSIWIEPSVTAEKVPPVLEVKPTVPDAMAKDRPESITKKIPPKSIDPRTDVLRISNQTQYPIRIVLRSHLNPNHPSPPNMPHFKEPVHWDFAPQEGSIDGLKVSLPSGPMQLYQGDVLMAFALDGSQKYWGPYVVGDTQQPILEKMNAEWHLVIFP
ncbi:hypothetical protein [Acaryochloris sp. CCMEE 5410]|uniref:hypothetical protein n=1 Tax=Acaryochloris sp. CCMEE 5410 TaxID=310037 RepID=UPI0002483B20|nr:hypothetical protein [Acaryochloris sp. CCMEE 5410]KAI9133250.1 hypothetical protein ON05_007925 [Acaryochloris sp. CCMEE 5410]